MKIKAIAMVAGAAMISMAAVGSAVAADGAALFMQKACASCHGADGDTPIMPIYPKLGGQNAAYAVNQMKDIKSGARNNGQTAAMKAIIAQVSDEEMQAIADWLASQ
jgi:cytochrome c